MPNRTPINPQSANLIRKYGIEKCHIQAFSFENTKRAKNGPCRIKQAGYRQVMCGNVAAKRGDTCLLFSD